MLREMLAQRQGVGEEMGEGDGMNVGRHGSADSGYFSRRSSKAVSTGGDKRESILMEELSEMVEEVGKEDNANSDSGAEEADDEGAGLEDPEEQEKGEEQEEEQGEGKVKVISLTGNGNEEDQAQKQPTALPPNQPTVTPKPELKHDHDHLTQLHPPQMRIGTRFLSPRRPAEPRLSADEAMGVARARHLSDAGGK